MNCTSQESYLPSPNGIQITTDDSQNTQIEDERMPFYTNDKTTKAFGSGKPPQNERKLILETAPFPLNHDCGKGRVTKAPLYEITLIRACVLVMEAHRRQGHRHNDTWPRHPPHSKESLGHTRDPPVILHKEGRKWHETRGKWRFGTHLNGGLENDCPF